MLEQAGLYLYTNTLAVTNAAGSENMIYAAENGAVTLYYDNAVKLATTSTGVDVTGTLGVSGALTASSDLSVAEYIYHIGDTNTYQRFQADQWTLRTGGGDRIYVGSSAPAGTTLSIITTNGYVGIGTTGPGTKLHVVDGTGELKFQNVSQANLLVSGVNAFINIDSIGSNYPGIRFKRSGTLDAEIGNLNGGAGMSLYGHGSGGMGGVFLTASGLCGIGTQTPGAILEIKDFSAAAPGTTLKVYSNANSAAADGLVFIHSDESLAPFTALNVRQDGTGDILNLLDGTTEVFTVLNGGNVGIGTAAPDSKLEINTPTTDAHLHVIKLSQNSWSSSQGKIKSIVWDDLANPVGGIGMSYDGSKTSMHFHSFYNGGYKTESDELMTILGDGKVGIGITNPSRLLDVNGATRLRGALYDKNNSYGTSGQVLSTTGSGGVDWVSAGGSGTVTSVATGTGLTGGTITTSGTISLTTAGAGAGSHGSTSNSTKIDTITLDAYGRVTAVATGATGSGNGTVTSVATTGAITGGTITSSGTIAHSTSAGYKHVPTAGAAGQFLKYSSSGTATWVGHVLDMNNYLHIAQRYDAGTSTGGALSGGQWNTRTLNATIQNNYSGTQFGYLGTGGSANRIILKAGTYYARVWAIAYDIDEQQINLANLSQGSTLLIVAPMSTKSTPSTTGMTTMAQGMFTIANNDESVVAYQWANTAETNTYGGGRALGSGTAGPDWSDYDYDTFVSVEIWKLA